MKANKLIFIYSLLTIIISIIFNYFYIKKIFINNFLIKLISNNIFILLIYILFLIYSINKFINNKLLYKIIFVTILTLILGQLIKIIIKNITKVKRPYIKYNKQIISLYKINNLKKNKFMEYIINNFFFKKILLIIKKIIKINNLYSFPSGHAILIHNLSSLIIIFYSHLNINIILLFILIFWSFVIIYNRIFYKMHKLIDIIFGILINFILIIFINIFYIKFN